MDFTGQHVVITGASTGIGRATAAKVASLGGTVTLIARRADVLAEAVAEIGGKAGFIVADVGDKAQLLEALDKAVEQSGAIDGLFLNAAYEGMYELTPSYTDEAFEQVLRVNVESPFWAIVGSLEVGKYADLVILDRDPKAVPPQEIGALEVVETWIEGKRRFQA